MIDAIERAKKMLKKIPNTPPNTGPDQGMKMPQDPKKRLRPLPPKSTAPAPPQKPGLPDKMPEPRYRFPEESLKPPMELRPRTKETPDMMYRNPVPDATKPSDSPLITKIPGRKPYKLKGK